MNRRKFILTSSILLGAFGLGLGNLFWSSRWKYIVIHHSAGSRGSIRLLQRVHRQRQPYDPIDAIPYHYIIGNGNGLKMGEVTSDWRGKCNIWGAHVSASNRDYNFRGIGICLIGNFENTNVPDAQYASLVNLTGKLMRKYGILPENVQGHGYLKGEATKCPGKYFPVKKFKEDISKLV